LPIPCNPDEEDLCRSTPCVNAQKELIAANNAITLDCQQAQNDVSTRNAWAAVAATLLVVMGVFIAAAIAAAAVPILGWIAAVVLFALAAVFFCLAGACAANAYEAQQKVDADHAKLISDQQAANAAVTQVEEHCPICCWPSLLVASCGQGAG
jgi:Na+/melibiose symporter-like transporter